MACLLAMVLPPLAQGIPLEDLMSLGNQDGLKMFCLVATILLVGFGAGMTSAAAGVRWDPPKT